jgi:hypothetical protein
MINICHIAWIQFDSLSCMCLFYFIFCTVFSIRYYFSPPLKPFFAFTVRPHSEFCICHVTRCSADTSLNVWQWSRTLNHVVGRVNVAHSCRNFEKIKEWTLERRMRKWIDMDLWVDDGLPDIPLIYG